jgi:hypothetical protein
MNKQLLKVKVRQKKRQCGKCYDELLGLGICLNCGKRN